MITKLKARKFLDELYELYQKHNISISHEDSQGEFILEEMKKYNIDWMEEHFNTIEE